MTKFAFELDSTEITFKRSGIEMTVNLDNFNADIIGQLVIHGLIQKVGDAAAGKTGDEAQKAMEAVVESLSQGDWGRTRGTGTGLTDLQKAMIAEIRPHVKAAKAAEYKKATQADRDAMCAKAIAALKPEQYAMIEKRAQAAIDAAKQNAALKLDITI